jgi:hypothetical protein
MMARIHEFAREPDSPANQAATAIPTERLDAFLDYLRRRMWQEFREHEKDVLFDVKILGLRIVKRTVGQVFKKKFEQWFGKPPVDLPKPGAVQA